MTKPTMWRGAQRKLRSAWAPAQSYQSLRCPHEESLGPQLPIEYTAKTLIRLGGSESSLGTHPFCWFCHVAAQIIQENAFSEAIYIACPPVVFVLLQPRLNSYKLDVGCFFLPVYGIFLFSFQNQHKRILARPCEI